MFTKSDPFHLLYQMGFPFSQSIRYPSLNNRRIIQVYQTLPFLLSAARYVPLAQQDGVVDIVQRLANSTNNVNSDVIKAALLLLEEIEPYRSPRALRCKIVHTTDPFHTCNCC